MKTVWMRNARVAWFGGLSGAMALGMLLTACSEEAVPENRDTASPSAIVEGVVDWDRRTVSLETPDWSLAFCEGDGPFLCVAREAGPIGAVELLRIPVRDHAIISGALNGGLTNVQALESAAAEFVAGLASDRRVGFGENYRLQHGPTAPVTVFGEPGLKLVLQGRMENQVQERIVQYHAIQRDTVYILAATGSAGGMLGEFSPEDLARFEATFDEVAAASRMGRPLP